MHLRLNDWVEGAAPKSNDDPAAHPCWLMESGPVGLSLHMRASALANHPDEFLVEQFKATRDEDYFAELVRRYTRRIFSACRRTLNNDAVAEEVTQDTFMSAFSHVESFYGGAVYPWLWKIARNRCVNYLKSTAVTREKSGNEVLEAITVQRDCGADVELAEQIRKVFDELAPPQRISLKLFCVEGYSYREIARITGYPMGKVKSYLQNGMRRFRLLWEDLQRGESQGEKGEYERRAPSVS
jgi:RNA polymerase sigma-70 factor, ECF subfamily